MQELIDFRQELHRHPELSGHEKNTAKRVADILNQFNPTKLLENIGGYGLVALFEFPRKGPTVLFRCELDALPIQEKNTFAHSSTVQSVAHKCGHDGHMAILCGLAQSIHQNQPESGTLILLFQPAEETGRGAKAMLEDPKFKEVQPDFVFSLHNLPGMPMHQILWTRGQFTPTVHSVAITLKGKSCHASEPENGINPATAIAEIVQGFKALEIPDNTRDDFTLLTPIHITMGQKDYGISAGAGELHYTLRCRSTEQMDRVVKNCYAFLEKTCATYQLSYDTDWFDYFPSVKNDDFCNDCLLTAIKSKELESIESITGCKFGEDFGFFTQQYPGTMFGLGAGLETPALHHDDYDFPDELIATGVGLFRSIYEIVQKK